MVERLNHTHGDTGEQPPDDLNFQSGDKPNPEQFDWFWNNVSSVIDSHADTLETIDSDGDGQVDAADSADQATNVTETYKGNDIDTDGDGTVNNADIADEAKRMEIRTSDPTDPDDGQMWIRSDL